jgi:hypothetical protein
MCAVTVHCHQVPLLILFCPAVKPIVLFILKKAQCTDVLVVMNGRCSHQLRRYSDSDLFQTANGFLLGGSITTTQHTNTQVTYTIYISHKITPLKIKQRKQRKIIQLTKSHKQ